MNKRTQSGAASSKDAALPSPCKAEFIFYAQAQRDRSKPVKVLGDYVCDFTRPDWEHRWREWNSRLNPYLHLFLCAEHARELGLSPSVDPRD
jgi:hypothetical protein